MEKVMEKSWNDMEFGFENCVGTLIIDAFVFSIFQTCSSETVTDDCKGLEWGSLRDIKKNVSKQQLPCQWT